MLWLATADRIKVKVSNGWVTLEGDVDHYYQRAAAERAVQPLLGVRGVSNFLTLREVPTASDLKQSIRDALARQGRGGRGPRHGRGGAALA